MHDSRCAMPADSAELFPVTDRYLPRRPAHFSPVRVVLARGSRSSPERRGLVDAVCRLYPEANVSDCDDVPHNRAPLPGSDPLEVHRHGKKTLVFGEHRSVVGLSEETGNCCPNYWHFSPYGFCPYGCTYCYLAGTRGVYFSPTVKIFLNLPEILGQIHRVACEAGRSTGFYLGKLQDGLALDPLTGYSRIMVPFFANHPLARLIVLTKAADVENLLDLPHGEHTILSWSLNPPEVGAEFERNTPPVECRIEAMRKCAAAGYPVRVVLMPIIPLTSWEPIYERFLVDFLRQVRPERITLGGVCSYPNALRLTQAKMGTSHAIAAGLGLRALKSADGRARYPLDLRVRIYQHLIGVIRDIRPDVTVGLCLEEQAVFEAVAMRRAIGRCNCVL
jgi:spore photoproduct lyase